VASLLSIVGCSLEVRKREFAVRSALGAGPLRITFELIVGPVFAALAGIMIISWLILCPWGKAIFDAIPIRQPDLGPVAAAGGFLFLVVLAIALMAASDLCNVTPAEALHERGE
jgi:hypothetical protein